jgi:hypothetical protein
MADIKRLHYFNHQFLVESDFTDEQQYHLVMRRRHNAALHDYGVADGLAVSRSGDREITIQPGMAIDRGGRELVLLDSRIVSLSDTAAFPCRGDGPCHDRLPRRGKRSQYRHRRHGRHPHHGKAAGTGVHHDAGG